MNILKRFFILFFVFYGLLLADEKVITIVSSENTQDNLRVEGLIKKHVENSSSNTKVQTRVIKASSNHNVSKLENKDIENSDYIIAVSQDHKDAVLKTYPKSKGKVFTFPELAKDKSDNLSDLYEESNQYDQNVENQIDKYLPFALDKVNQMDN